MGRRSEHTPEELRELILGATRQVIVDAGFQRLSAREIARAIGYAPGTLYNMFRNLDEILMRVEARVLDELDEAIGKAVHGNRGNDAVRRFATACVEFAYQNPRLWELIQEHHPVNRSTGPDWYTNSLYAPLARLEVALTRLTANGEAEEATRTARLVWAAVHGIVNVATTTKYGPLPLATTLSMAESMVASIVAGATRTGRRDESRHIDPDTNRDRPTGQ